MSWALGPASCAATGLKGCVQGQSWGAGRRPVRRGHPYLVTVNFGTNPVDLRCRTGGTGTAAWSPASRYIAHFKNKLAALRDRATDVHECKERRQMKFRYRSNPSTSASNNRFGLYEHDWHPRKRTVEPVEEQTEKNHLMAQLVIWRTSLWDGINAFLLR